MRVCVCVRARHFPPEALNSGLLSAHQLDRLEQDETKTVLQTDSESEFPQQLTFNVTALVLF